jgi:hypothetical protein
MFNPHPTVTTLPISATQVCVVIDDVLLDPQALVDMAVKHRQAFELASGNAYPGLELPMSDAVSARIADFFALHARRALGGRRTVRVHSRLSMVTLPPDELRPLQRVPHRDRLAVDAGQFVAASVLYLFHRAELGGTSFYAPRQPLPETEQLMTAWNGLSKDEFTRRLASEPAYVTGSNAYFEKVLTVPARWNRMIAYDGGQFHCSHLEQPALLSDDPACGRLTLNPFFICTRQAA